MLKKTDDHYIYEKELFKQVYHKIETEMGGKSKNNSSILLESILEDDYRFYDAKSRTLIRYYDRFVLEKEVSCGNPSNILKNNLADFLTYTDYNEFVLSLKKDNPISIASKKKKNNNSKHVKKTTFVKTIALIGIVAFVAIFYSLSIFPLEKNTMVWKSDHYEKYSDEIDMQSLGVQKLTLVPYNTEAINKHQKIKLTCEDPIKNVWYYKVHKNELEFYNFPGLHPVNGKTLKALTIGMKQKYVCEKTPVISNDSTKTVENIFDK